MTHSALLGKPTTHSVSHILFPLIAAAAGIPGPYEHIRLDVEPEGLPTALTSLSNLGFVGANVTLPYKIKIIDLLDEVDTVALELGAVNTVKLGARTIGHNTDWIGIAEPLRKTHASFRHAVILGTGGAARAAIYASRQLGARQIDVFYRAALSEQSKQLMNAAAKLDITLRAYDQLREQLDSADLIVNATSAGMVGRDTSPIDVGAIQDIQLTDKVYLDAVFNPLQTPLLVYFSQKGARTIDGLWMMIYQAVGALSVWTGSKIAVPESDLEAIHQRLKKDIQSV